MVEALAVKLFNGAIGLVLSADAECVTGPLGVHCRTAQHRRRLTIFVRAESKMSDGERQRLGRRVAQLAIVDGGRRSGSRRAKEGVKGPHLQHVSGEHDPSGLTKRVRFAVHRRRDEMTLPARCREVTRRTEKEGKAVAPPAKSRAKKGTRIDRQQ